MEESKEGYMIKGNDQGDLLLDLQNKEKWEEEGEGRVEMKGEGDVHERKQTCWNKDNIQDK